MRTCISHKEYSQAMSRYQIWSISRESPIRYGLRGPWKHPQRAPTLSKEGLGSCAQQTNPKPALDRFGWQHKSPWWYSVRCRHHNYLVRFRKNNYLVRFRVRQKACQAKTSLGRVGLVRHRHIYIPALYLLPMTGVLHKNYCFGEWLWREARNFFYLDTSKSGLPWFLQIMYPRFKIEYFSMTRIVHR